MKAVSKNEKKGKTISKLEKYQPKICKELGVTPKRLSRYYFLLNSPVKSQMNRSDDKDNSLSLAFATDLERNISIIGGEFYSEDGLTDDGAIEVVVPQELFVNKGLLIGERLIFNNLKTIDNDPITIEIKGVFNCKSDDPFYWQMKNKDLSISCFMNEELFLSMFTGDNAKKYTVNCFYYTLFDYENITAEQVSHILSRTDYLTKKSKYKGVMGEPVYYELFEEYIKDDGGKAWEILSFKAKDQKRPKFVIMPPLGTKEADNIIYKSGAAPDILERPTGKTGVAFGLLDSYEGSEIEIIDLTREGSNKVPFQFYVGRNRRKKFKPILFRGDSYKKWIKFIDAAGAFELYYADKPEAATGEMPITVAKRMLINPEIKDKNKFVFIQAINPKAINYIVAGDVSEIGKPDKDNKIKEPIKIELEL